MTASHGLGTYGNGVGTVTPNDHKLDNAGFIAKASSSLAIRAGVFWGGADNLVTGTSGMTYNVAAFTAVLTRGATSGAISIANDGVVNVATIAAPGSNSRYDVVYIWQREYSIDGTDSNPVIGVLNGTAAATPSIPALTAFPGAIALANILVPSGVTATNTGTTITQSAPFTATAGGVVMFRNSTEQAASVLPQGTISSLITTTAMFVSNGTTWNTLGASGLVPVIPSSVTGTGAALGANGRITLTAVTAFSILGAFTATFDNYRILLSGTWSAASTWWSLALANSGTGATTGHDAQRLTASGASVVGTTTATNGTGWQTPLATGYANQWGPIELYNPFLAVPTRGIWDGGESDGAGALVLAKAEMFHRASTSFDGLALARATGTATFTGTIQIYGYNNN